MKDRPLSQEGVELFAQFADDFSELVELTGNQHALEDFSQGMKFSLGDENRERVLSRAHKFAKAVKAGTENTETTVVDPQIQTMSLQERKQAQSHLQRMGLTSEPVRRMNSTAGPIDEGDDAMPDVESRLAGGGLIDRLDRLRLSGRCSKSEYRQHVHNTDQESTERFIQSREPVPEGTFGPAD